MPISSRWLAGVGAVVALASAAGCGRTSRANVVVDVYVAGYETNSPYYVAKLWKNGVSQPLSDTANGSIATAVAVDGDDVYVAGCTSLGITVWRNGVAEVISTAAEGCAEDVVVSGGDVYVAGYESYHPMLWKNGVGQILPHDMSSRADTRALAVSGADVYVAGWAFVTTQTSPTSTLTTQAATLWKDGVAYTLSDGLSPAIARGVAVEGADVHVVGDVVAKSRSVATLWRNGVAQSLSDGVVPSLATDVAAAGGDVWVVGGFSAGLVDAAAVWHGGVRQALTDGRSQAFAEAVAVSSTGVYVAGYEAGSAMLWHDGAPSRLSDPSYGADALDVAVVERPQ